MDSHIIVHSDAESATGFGSLNQYYVTKGGSAVKISNTTDGRLTSDFDQTSTGFYVQGGFQVDNDSLINVLRTYDRRQETTGYGNGMTYVIDRPIQTTMKSVYSVLADGAEASPFYQFFNLCQIDADILDRAGLADSVDNDEVESELEKYTIFTSSQNGLTDNVRFFNTFRYTVYVPTNEAIQEAFNQGLPTWDDITEVITSGEAEVMIAAREGKAIRFNENTVRPIGRVGAGVRGISLDEGDEVVGMICIEPNSSQDVLVLSENGYGKRTDLDEYRITNRGGKGVKTINITEKTGKLISIQAVTDENDLMIINRSGLTIRTAVDQIRVAGRATQGVRIINLREGDAIASVIAVPANEEEEPAVLDGAGAPESESEENVSKEQ